jgi:DNA segregation ATPase FtsK/SpoIIIE, S-DNA-T family
VDLELPLRPVRSSRLPVPGAAGRRGWQALSGRDESTACPHPPVAACASAASYVTLAASCGLATLHFSGNGAAANPGGIVGDIVSSSLITPFSFIGTTLFLLALFLTGITLFTGLSWLLLMDTIGRWTCDFFGRFRHLGTKWQDFIAARKVRRIRAEAVEANAS